MTRPIMSTGSRILRPLENETFHALAEELAGMTTSDYVLSLLSKMTEQYDELDQEHTEATAKWGEFQATAEQQELTIDNICNTFDMVQTGFRDHSDLARVIQYA
jgi:hypothetical protein